jgi:hypothetical protein
MCSFIMQISRVQPFGSSRETYIYLIAEKKLEHYLNEGFESCTGVEIDRNDRGGIQAKDQGSSKFAL